MARNIITSSGGVSLRGSGSGGKKLIIFVLVVSVFLTLQATTQFIAYRFSYNPGLGAFWVISSTRIYPFYKCLFWFVRLVKMYFSTKSQAVSSLFYQSSMIFAVGCLFSVVATRWAYTRSHVKALNSLHGSARWASLKEIIQAGLLDKHGQSNKEGVVVGGFSPSNRDKDVRILRHSGREHIMVYAPTRSGKGVSLVLPTLLDGWNESSFVFDIKGENFALTAGYRASIGHKILKLDFTDPKSIEQGTSATFNPLEEVNLDYCVSADFLRYDETGKLRDFALRPAQTSTETAAIQQIVAIIVDPQGKGLEDHWSRTASSLMLGCITHLLYKAQVEKKPCPGIADVLSEFTQPGKTSKEIIESWKVYPHLGGRWEPSKDNPKLKVFTPIVHPVVAEEAQSLSNKPDKERGSVISTAVSNLALFRDPVVTRNTSRSSFRIRDLMHHDSPVDLYMIVNPNDQLRLMPLTRLLTTQIVFKLAERMAFKDGKLDEESQYKYRLLLLLDEFPSLGRMELFEKALGFIGGYGIKAFIVCQGLAQLYKSYTKDESLRIACHIQIAFAPNEQETAEYLSKLTGQQTIIKENITETRRRGTLFGVDRQKALQEVQRPLLTPDECRRLPGLTKDSEGRVCAAGDMLIFPAGYSAIYGRQTLYFKDKRMSSRSKKASPGTSDYLLPSYVGAKRAYNALAGRFEELQKEFYDSLEAVKKAMKAAAPVPQKDLKPLFAEISSIKKSCKERLENAKGAKVRELYQKLYEAVVKFASHDPALINEFNSSLGALADLKGFCFESKLAKEKMIGVKHQNLSGEDLALFKQLHPEFVPPSREEVEEKHNELRQLKVTVEQLLGKSEGVNDDVKKNSSDLLSDIKKLLVEFASI